jgi:hypothetical protein
MKKWACFGTSEDWQDSKNHYHLPLDCLSSFEATYKTCVLKSVLGCNLTWCWISKLIRSIMGY